MKKIAHKSADASHYNKEADSYDLFNDKNSIVINETIGTVLKKHRVKSVIDLTCGTGSQVFWLHNHGFEACGYDINSKMIKIAKEKAKSKKLALSFNKGDIRTTRAGQFDAVLSIFNAVGHLTKSDFKRAMRNVRSNLNPGGLYIFDIFNLEYLLDGDNITKLTIDWLKRTGNRVIREIQYSTIDTDGVLASYDHYYEKDAATKTKTSTASQTLQVYSADELKEMLAQCGFKAIRQCNVDGTRFSRKKSERILTIAKLAG